MKQKIKGMFRKLLMLTMAAALLLSQVPPVGVWAMESGGEADDASGDDGGVVSGRKISKDQVTFETTANYVHEIYANGMPLIIVASETDERYAEIYVDENENGIVDAGEEFALYRGDGKLGGNGIYYKEGMGYYLTGSTIYGGAKDGDHAYNTRITFSGSRSVGASYTVKQIYGGSKYGTLNGGTSVCINGGKIYNVFGGGLESEVTGKATVTVNGGYAAYVYASGAGSETAAAPVGSADVQLKGGTVFRFQALFSEYTDIKERLAVEADGAALTWLLFGSSGNTNPLQDVSISLKNGKFKYLYLYLPIQGNLDISFENAEAENYYMVPDILENAQESRLTFRNCGAEGNQWGKYDPINPWALEDAGNPTLSCYYWNSNCFDSITMENSYINFLDQSNAYEEWGLKSAAKQLVIDGGALRIVNAQTANMPDTVFANNPLLLRSAERSPISFKNATIKGTARVQWFGLDGVSEPENALCFIIETESDTPEETFAAAKEGSGMRTISLTHGNGEWYGTAWYVDTVEKLCTCSLHSGSLKENFYILPAGEAEGEFALEDIMVSGFTGNSCGMAEHKKTRPTAEFSLITEGTTAEGAVIEGGRLKVSGCGIVNIKVDRRLNQKSDFYTAAVNVIQAPVEKTYTVVHEAEQDLVLEFAGMGEISNNQMANITFGWNLITSQCQVEINNDQIRFTILAEYLKTLDLGTYRFDAYISAKDIKNNLGNYDHIFTVYIVPPKEVADPVIEIQGGPFHYDGTPKEPEVIVKDGDTVIPDSEYTVSYENNTLAGTATVKITDNPKGLYTVSGSTTFEILNEFQPKRDTEYTTSGLNEKGWANEEFVITAKDGYLLSIDNTLADTWTDSLTASAETADGALAFYVKNTENGRISLKAEESYKLDQTAPGNFGITYQGESVTKDIGEEAFTLLFNGEVNAALSAEDPLSGIAEICCYSSDHKMSLAELKQADGWVSGGRFTIKPEDGKQFVIYARAVDNAGNTVYFAGEGAEFDLTPPAFSGAEEGTDYYTTQKVAVTDKNLKEVTLDGQRVSDPGSILIPGNVEKTYVIRAVDEAGNESVLTITMKPIESLGKMLEGLTVETVTSADLDTVNQAALVAADENTTTEEREALSQIADQASRLKDRIEEAASAIQTAAVEEVKDISAGNVQITDQERLQQAREGLEKALTTYPGNYTEEEKRSIQEEISRMEAAIKSIENALDVTQIITSLADPGKVQPDDEAAEDAARLAKEAYDQLTNHEKFLVEESYVQKLEELLAALMDYRILEGDRGIWEEGQAEGLAFKANGALRNFTGVKVDGNLLAAENYEARNGSTILTLKESCLDRLSTGKHILTVLYRNGEASAEFTVFRVDEFVAEKNVAYIAGGLNENGWTNQDFRVTAKEGYLLSTENTVTAAWTDSLSAGDETSNGVLEFYVKNLENSQISCMAREAYKIDRTAPEGFDITYQGTSVKKELGTESFGLIFGERVEAALSAEDSLSGIADISYYSSDHKMSLEELKQVAGWVSGSRFVVEPEHGKQFITYGRALDKAGNAVYFASEGAEFDTEPPVFSGAEEGCDYYTTKKVTVTDKNLREATVNGEAAPDPGSILLPGNIEKTYVISAVDAGGNESLLTITMRPIESLGKKIAGLTTGNVTSDDLDLINQIILAMTDENTTPEEHKALEQFEGRVLELKNQVGQALSAARTEAVEKVKDISAENVQMGDQKNLRQAKKDLEKALKTYPGNYTEAEKTSIRESISRIEASLTSIEHVLEVTGAIGALPEAGTVSPDDEEAEDAVLSAKAGYDGLTEHEQSLVEEPDIRKLEDLLAALKDYRILEGHGGVWEEGQKGGLTFKANGAFRKFIGIKIDGILISAENYTARKGSTILTIRQSFLNQLSEGNHTLTVLYTDGETSAEFTVSGKSEKPDPGTPEKPGKDPGVKSPETSDRNWVWIWYLVVFSAAVMIGLGLCRRRKGRGRSRGLRI